MVINRKEPSGRRASSVAQVNFSGGCAKCVKGAPLMEADRNFGLGPRARLSGAPDSKEKNIFNLRHSLFKFVT